MSLYNIIDRSEQATVRPAYQLKNYREKHARYSNHLTFLSKCRAQGIIPNGLKVALPVRSARANNIALKTSQALLRERIGNARRQKAVTSARISKLESHLSQSLSAERWTSLEEFCKDSAARTYRSTKEKQIHKFQHQCNSWRRPPRPKRSVHYSICHVNCSLIYPSKLISSRCCCYSLTPGHLFPI